jgi:hypothetical protein
MFKFQEIILVSVVLGRAKVSADFKFPINAFITVENQRYNRVWTLPANLGSKGH